MVKWIPKMNSRIKGLDIRNYDDIQLIFGKDFRLMVSNEFAYNHQQKRKQNEQIKELELKVRNLTYNLQQHSHRKPTKKEEIDRLAKTQKDEFIPYIKDTGIHEDRNFRIYE